MKTHRFVISSLVVGAILFGVMLIPLPHYVRCSFYVQPQEVENVFVDVPGLLQTVHAQQNAEIKKGDQIATLISPELHYQLLTIEREVWDAKISYETAEKSADRDSQLVPAADAAFETYRASVDKYNQRLVDLDRLVISARTNGTLIPPPVTEKPDQDSGELPSWHGLPLEKDNEGAYLEQRTLLGQIIPEDSSMEAVLAIAQEDIDFVLKDQSVELWVDQIAGKTYDATTYQISPVKMEAIPKALSSRFGGRVFTVAGPNGQDKPENTTFQVSVPLNDSRELFNGASGKAKVHVGYQTVGQKVWRTACRTFRFEL